MAEPIKVVMVYPRLPEASKSPKSPKPEIGRSRSRIFTLGGSAKPDELSRVKATSRIAMAAMMLLKSLAGGASRPGIESTLALLGTAGAAATTEATAVATAEGIVAVARAVETMAPTAGPAGAIEGINGGKN